MLVNLTNIGGQARHRPVTVPNAIQSCASYLGFATTGSSAVDLDVFDFSSLCMHHHAQPVLHTAPSKSFVVLNPNYTVKKTCALVLYLY